MKDILRTSFLGFVGTLFILALLQPFGIDQLQENRLFFILCHSICVLICVTISQLLYRLLFPTLYNSKAPNIWWAALYRIPLCCFIVLLLSASFSVFNGWFFQEEIISARNFFSVMPGTIIVTCIMLVWVVYVDQNNKLQDELQEMVALNQLLAERQEQRTESDNGSDSSMPEIELPTVHLESNTNGITLEVSPQDIIYIESMANYADICYMKDGGQQRQTLRITMKQLRESLANIPYLVSCHRAFIVNINFILSISTRPTGGYQLQIFGQETQIPIARSYTEEIKTALKKRNEA